MVIATVAELRPPPGSFAPRDIHAHGTVARRQPAHAPWPAYSQGGHDAEEFGRGHRSPSLLTSNCACSTERPAYPQSQRNCLLCGNEITRTAFPALRQFAAHKPSRRRSQPEHHLGLKAAEMDPDTNANRPPELLLSRSPPRDSGRQRTGADLIDYWFYITIKAWKRPRWIF